MRTLPPRRAAGQATLHQWSNKKNECQFANIDPVGDPLKPRFDGDGITRIGYQNVNTSTMGQGFDVAEEIDVIAEIGSDIHGMSEINKPWNSSNKWQYDTMMDVVFQRSRTTYAAMEADHDCERQQGGNLLTVNNATAGRFQDHGSDKWGRFCWQTYRGKRDEGIVVITAYRVCHEASDHPGPFTAYTQQYTAMREEGIASPNPRKQILADLLSLIDAKRLEGFRPILMMDANGDYTSVKAQDRDKDLESFIRDANLVDHFHEKFPDPTHSYVYGSKRLDYILVDPALVDAIERIGYLGTHEGACSDHVLAYVDFSTSALFKGKINRPVDIHAREFRLEQRDKVIAFLE